MTAPQLVILADDLTGAADTGGSFAGAGLVTAVPLGDAATPAVDVLSLSSESRDIDDQEVPNRVQATLKQAISDGHPDRWYKKIDSALRGYPGLEIALTIESQGFTSAIIAPALPSEGRVTIEGRIYVHGLLLHTTTLGKGLSSSFVIEQLRRHTDAKIVWIGLDSVRRGAASLLETITATGQALIVIDAISDQELLTIAEAATHLPNVLLAGSAGFAAALMQVLPLQSQAPKPPPPSVTGQPVLTIAGSRHESTVRQINHAAHAGMTVIRPEQIDHSWTPGEIASLRENATLSLADGNDTILTLTGCPRSIVPGCQLAAQLAEVAAEPCLQGLVGGLVLTGGDVAAAVCGRLGADFLWLRGEVLPAIPWATLGTGPLENMPIVTKAGSFGAASAFTDSVSFLRTLAG